MYERCTPALVAALSLEVAMLGSLREAEDVLGDRGIAVDTKMVRLIADRAAESRAQRGLPRGCWVCGKSHGPGMAAGGWRWETPEGAFPSSPLVEFLFVQHMQRHILHSVI
jgi:hypothetical protein